MRIFTYRRCGRSREVQRPTPFWDLLFIKALHLVMPPFVFIACHFLLFCLFSRFLTFSICWGFFFCVWCTKSVAHCIDRKGFICFTCLWDTYCEALIVLLSSISVIYYFLTIFYMNWLCVHTQQFRFHTLSSPVLCLWEFAWSLKIK